MTLSTVCLADKQLCSVYAFFKYTNILLYIYIYILHIVNLNRNLNRISMDYSRNEMICGSFSLTESLPKRRDYRETYEEENSSDT